MVFFLVEGMSVGVKGSCDDWTGRVSDDTCRAMPPGRKSPLAQLSRDMCMCPVTLFWQGYDPVHRLLWKASFLRMYICPYVCVYVDVCMAGHGKGHVRVRAVSEGSMAAQLLRVHVCSRVCMCVCVCMYDKMCWLDMAKSSWIPHM